MQDTGEILVRTTKAGTHVYTWVPEWLQERIRARANQFGPLIFGAHQTRDINVITDVWRRKLKNLWKLCGSRGRKNRLPIASGTPSPAYSFNVPA